MLSHSNKMNKNNNLFVIVFVLALTTIVCTEITCVGDVCGPGDDFDYDGVVDTHEQEEIDNTHVLKELEEFGLEWIQHPKIGYYISSTETTVGQFKKCAESGACTDDAYQADGYGCSFSKDNNKLPMNCVDWIGADQFCKWIDAHICTEDEWNAACEGTKKGQIYPYGNRYVDGNCNLGVATSSPGTIEEVKSRDACVGGIEGLYDMGGNLSEWLGNYKEDTNYRKFKPHSYAFNGPLDKNVCTAMCAGNARETREDKIFTGLSTPSLGFRCCRDI